MHARRYNPIKTIKTSFIGTMNMLGLAKRTHARFLLTSTSEVGKHCGMMHALATWAARLYPLW